MSFKVTILPKNETFMVADNDNVLEAALRAGHHLPYGCRGGTCGSCRAKILSGDIAYPNGDPVILSKPERASGQALLCQVHPRSDLVVEMRNLEAVGALVVKTLPCRVMRLEKLAHDVMRLYLKLPATEQLQFLAGQYVDIILRDSRKRSFSLASPPHIDEHLELHVRHVPGGKFTDVVFNSMKEKTILRFQGPLGAFFLRNDSDKPIILLAGGTGFAPIKAILEDAFFKGINRPIHFYWGARARRDLYLNDLVNGWVEKHPDFRYTPVLSEPSDNDDWQGRRGFVHSTVAQDNPDLTQHQVYMSGPPAMIEAAKSAFFAHGLPDDQLFYDSFDYALE
jgi:CDP-4-dehydro-6-deoxyglucose reductase